MTNTFLHHPGALVNGIAGPSVYVILGDLGTLIS